METSGASARDAAGRPNNAATFDDFGMRRAHRREFAKRADRAERRVLIGGSMGSDEVCVRDRVQARAWYVARGEVREGDWGRATMRAAHPR